jgi:acyl carrier protein
MSDLERLLVDLVRAHAPAATSGTLDAFDASLELRADVGFDLIALAELAVVLEDAFGIAIDLTDLERCRTLGDLKALLVARGV